MNVLPVVVLDPVKTTWKIRLSTHLKTNLQELVKDASVKTKVCEISLNGSLPDLPKI